MDYLTLSGSPRKIGRQKAEFDGDYIARVWEQFYARHQSSRFDDWIRREVIPHNCKTWPWLAEELEGYREVSGYDLEFIYSYLFVGSLTRFTCSNIAIETIDQGIVFAKNTDLSQGEFDNIFFYHYKPDDGQQFFGYSYKASLTVQGMNESGLCLGGTSCSYKTDVEEEELQEATGLQFITRYLMQYGRTSPEAVEALCRYKSFAKGSALISLDADGRSDSLNLQYPMCHTRRNRLPAFCTGFFEIDNYEFPDHLQGSVAHHKARLAFAEKHFAGRGKVTLKELQEFLRRHNTDWSEPGQWCRHLPEDRYLETVVSHICIPAERRVLYCHGKPCQTEYKEFVFA